jgi:uncharacterized protein YbjQ (UPF0145 family)
MGDKDDLTRLEDLSEYIHELDAEVDSQLEDGSKALDAPPPPPPAIGLDELDSSNDLTESVDETFTSDDDFSSADNDLSLNEDQDLESINEDSFSNDDDFNSEEFSSNDFGGDEFYESSDFSDSSDFEESDDFNNDSFSNDDSNSDFSDPTEPDFQIGSGDFDSTAQFDSQDDTDNDLTSDEQSSFAIAEDNFDSDENFDNQKSLNTLDNNEQPEFSAEDQHNTKDTSDSGIEHDIERETQQEETQAISDEFSTLSPDSSSVVQESFKDVRSFAQHIAYGQVTRGGEPPFTLLIRNINYLDDVEDIKIILKEYGLYTDDNASLIDQSLLQGALILPQLSEFTAIFLANKLRRFSGDIQMGLSDEVHPSKGVNKKFKGLVSKENLLRNMKRSKKSYKEDFNKDAIIISTTPTIDQYDIKEYLGIISADITVSENFFHDNPIEQPNSTEQQEENNSQQMMQEFLSRFTIGTTAYYQEILEDIKNRAYQLGANGVVGLNYSITPLIDFKSGTPDGRYKILATGSAVTIEARSN